MAQAEKQERSWYALLARSLIWIFMQGQKNILFIILKLFIKETYACSLINYNIKSLKKKLFSELSILIRNLWWNETESNTVFFSTNKLSRSNMDLLLLFLVPLCNILSRVKRCHQPVRYEDQGTFFWQIQVCMLQHHSKLWNHTEVA